MDNNDTNDTIEIADTPLGCAAQIAYLYIAMAFLLALFRTLYDFIFASLDSGLVYFFVDKFIEALSWPTWLWNTLF